MFPKLVTKTMHAYLDYPVAISLILLPFVLGLGTSHPVAKWLAVATGIAAFILTIFTDHKLGIFPYLSYEFHLTVDRLVGVIFLIIPVVFGFSGQDAWYYWANASAVLLVTSLHKPEDADAAMVHA